MTSEHYLNLKFNMRSTKPLESDERDLELVWLQEEDSLNIRC